MEQLPESTLSPCGASPWNSSAAHAERSVGDLARLAGHDAQALVEPLLSEFGLGFAQWSALIALQAGVARTCAALARHIAHDTGTISRILYQLEKRGLVSCEQSDVDRRVFCLSLTPGGDAVVSACRDRLAAHWRLWLADWAHEDLDALV